MLAFVKEATGRSSVAPVKPLLATAPDDLTLSRFRTACQGDEKLWERIKPLRWACAARHVRLPGRHPAEERLRYGGDRPPHQRHALHAREPDRADRAVHAGALGLRGSIQGKPREQWRLRSPRNCWTSKVCDMACGSGAFLVQVCIYLSLPAPRSLGGSRETGAGLTPDHALWRGSRRGHLTSN